MPKTIIANVKTKPTDSWKRVNECKKTENKKLLVIVWFYSSLNFNKFLLETFFKIKLAQTEKTING